MSKILFNPIFYRKIFSIKYWRNKYCTTNALKEYGANNHGGPEVEVKDGFRLRSKLTLN